jgi:RND family efflux transporter MFP subunit
LHGKAFKKNMTTKRNRVPIFSFIKPAAKLIAVVGTVGGLGLILAYLAGVFRDKVSAERVMTSGDGVVGTVVEVDTITRESLETAVGSIRPVHETSIATRLLSRVVEVKVTAGQSVRKGDVLVRLDDADLKSRLLQSEAAVQSAMSQAERAKADFDRANELLKRNSVSQAEFDQARAAMLTANSDLERLQQERREAEIILGFSVISAPMDGMVIDKKVDVGDTVSPGSVLLTLYDPLRMQMIVNVRESLARVLTVGQMVQARLESLNQECVATISEIVPESQAASRSFLVKVVGPCPPGAYSGMFGRVWLPVGEETILAIPQSSVVRVGQLTMVSQVFGDQVQRRTVLLGREVEDGKIEVLAGLIKGDKIVIPSQQERS